MFDRILIANRGEIACRIIRTARELGVTSIALYSDADRDARHTRMADEAYRLPGIESSETYLNMDRVLELTRNAGAGAIHPGYGFLSENAEFASMVEESEITFVGPSSENIEQMAQKDRAKTLMENADVPVIPGYRGENQEPEFLREQAEEIGYPLLIKALSGGGGKGMRLVEEPENFSGALDACKRESQAAFGDDRVLLEKYIDTPRHIEVQVFGDQHGNAVHLFERDCSLQRRYQKVIEEAPAPGIPSAFRERIGEAAVRAVREIDYTNAGTLEFVADAAGEIEPDDFYFLEMNTRIQVEHPVTEMITGEDLIEWQIRVAAGEPLPRDQEEITREGHAFEARLYAEDPSNDFVPQTGTLGHFDVPEQNRNIRLDTGVEEGDEILIHYDPMIAKLIVYGSSREHACRLMHRTLRNTGIAGPTTNQEFLRNAFAHRSFQDASIDTNFIPDHRDQLIPEAYGQPEPEEWMLGAAFFLAGHPPDPEISRLQHDPWESGDHWRMNTDYTTEMILQSNGVEQPITVTCRTDEYRMEFKDHEASVCVQEDQPGHISLMVDGTRIDTDVVPGDSERDIVLVRDGRSIPIHHYLPGTEGAAVGGEDRTMASMPGKITNVYVSEGDEVEKNAAVLVMEAMKMEMTINAGQSGIVEQLPVSVDDQVSEGDLLIAISSE